MYLTAPFCFCFSPSNKPNPNQLSNNAKPALLNGAASAAGSGPPGSGQTPSLGRACESCYSKLCCGVTAIVVIHFVSFKSTFLANRVMKPLVQYFIDVCACVCVLVCVRACMRVASSSYQWYSWGPPNMQCRLCASCWTYWKKYGGLKMPTRLEGERPGPNRNSMVHE